MTAKEIKKFNDYNMVSSFIVEFIDAIKRDDFDFNSFMTSMYGSIEDFKIYNFNDLNEDYIKICKLLEKHYKIVYLVENDN